MKTRKNYKKLTFKVQLQIEIYYTNLYEKSSHLNKLKLNFCRQIMEILNYNHKKE